EGGRSQGEGRGGAADAGGADAGARGRDEARRRGPPGGRQIRRPHPHRGYHRSGATAARSLTATHTWLGPLVRRPATVAASNSVRTCGINLRGGNSARLVTPGDRGLVQRTQHHTMNASWHTMGL